MSAAQLGALTGATVVLGSATPSVESYWRARQGIYTLVELRERVPIPSASPEADIAQLPAVTLIDLRAELRSGNTSILSEALQEALAETLERGEQAILFLNRRGMATQRGLPRVRLRGALHPLRRVDDLPRDRGDAALPLLRQT